MSTLYIGAGIDVRRVLIDTPSNHHIIMVDSQPYSEFGKLAAIDPSSGRNLLSRPKFVKCLTNTLKRHKLEFDSTISSETKLSWRRSGAHVLTYFINTSIPEDIETLRPYLTQVDTLYVRGHSPHKNILDALPVRPLTFVGGCGTCYMPEEDTDENTITTLIDKLHSDSSYRDSFQLFVYITSDHGRVEHTRWVDFVKACS